MGSVHAVSRVKRAVQIIRRGQDDQAAIFPVVEISGSVEPHAPMPNRVLPGGFLLVFTESVIELIFFAVENRKAIGMDWLAARVKPEFVPPHSLCFGIKLSKIILAFSWKVICTK